MLDRSTFDRSVFDRTAIEEQSGAGEITGTLAATEGADSASFAGDVIVQGVLAATEGADSAAFEGESGQPQPAPQPQPSGGVNFPPRPDPRMLEMRAVADIRLKPLSCEAEAEIEWNPVTLDNDLLLLAAA